MDTVMVMIKINGDAAHMIMIKCRCKLGLFQDWQL
jgi:hypothetical protein